MKIKLLTNFYSDGKLVLVGKGNIFEIDNEKAEYLLRTFPHWFEKVETKEKELDIEIKEKPKKRGRRKAK